MLRKRFVKIQLVCWQAFIVWLLSSHFSQAQIKPPTPPWEKEPKKYQELITTGKIKIEEEPVGRSPDYKKCPDAYAWRLVSAKLSSYTTDPEEVASVKTFTHQTSGWCEKRCGGLKEEHICGELCDIHTHLNIEDRIIIQQLNDVESLAKQLTEQIIQNLSSRLSNESWEELDKYWEGQKINIRIVIDRNFNEYDQKIKVNDIIKKKEKSKSYQNLINFIQTNITSWLRPKSNYTIERNLKIDIGHARPCHILRIYYESWCKLGVKATLTADITFKYYQHTKHYDKTKELTCSIFPDMIPIKGKSEITNLQLTLTPFHREGTDEINRTENNICQCIPGCKPKEPPIPSPDKEEFEVKRKKRKRGPIPPIPPALNNRTTYLVFVEKDKDSDKFEPTNPDATYYLIQKDGSLKETKDPISLKEALGVVATIGPIAYFITNRKTDDIDDIKDVPVVCPRNNPQVEGISFDAPVAIWGRAPKIEGKTLDGRAVEIQPAEIGKIDGQLVFIANLSSNLALDPSSFIITEQEKEIGTIKGSYWRIREDKRHEIKASPTPRVKVEFIRIGDSNQTEKIKIFVNKGIIERINGANLIAHKDSKVIAEVPPGNNIVCVVASVPNKQDIIGIEKLESPTSATIESILEKLIGD